MRGFVYFIASPETGRVKIGFTAKDPQARLRSLQTGSPTELRLMCFTPGTMADEASLHELLRDYRIHGEWFDAGDPVIFVMAKVCQKAIEDFSANGMTPPNWAIIGSRATAPALAAFEASMEAQV